MTNEIEEAKEIDVFNLSPIEQRIYELLLKGIIVEKVARYFDVSRNHLFIHYGQLIKTAIMHREEAIRDAQMNVAVKVGNPTMLIWLGKNELAQTDVPASTFDNDVSEISFTVKRIPKPAEEADES